MLSGKNILIGISGGIAAYKICELIRMFKRENANIRVICTPNALNFVTKLTLQNLSRNEVGIEEFEIPNWVTWTCAITMAAGTACGGWKIIKTMGSKLVRMTPIHGFAAQSTAALVIQIASHMGIPLSTTHVISSSIIGVGATKRFSAVKWSVAGEMVWAWILTLPITCGLGFYIMKIVQWIGNL